MKQTYKINSIYFKKQIFAILLGFIFVSSSFGQSGTGTGSGDGGCNNAGAACSAGSHKEGGGGIYVQNGNDTLGLVYNNTACGLSYVQGSVLIEKRSVTYGFNTTGTGLPSKVTISNIPCTKLIQQAYVWIIASYTETTPPPVTVSVTNPANVTSTYSMVVVGKSGPKCWAEKGTATYRADVTAAVTGNGLYGMSITGFTNGGNEIDGATMLIVYQNTAVPFQGTLIIYDGTMTSGQNNSYRAKLGTPITGFTACDSSSYANAFLITSDMQANINGGNHQTTLNGVATTFPNTFWNFDVANTKITKGQTSSSIFTDGKASDCYSVGVEGLYFQTTTCTVCTPASTLTLTATSNTSACGTCNGAATVSASGGTGVYTYRWDNGQNTATATGLCAGTYSVSVSDNTGCSSGVTSVVVDAHAGPTVTIAATQSAGCINNTIYKGYGTVTLTATASSPVVSYQWYLNGVLIPGATNQSIVVDSAGAFNVIVKDAFGCTSDPGNTVPIEIKLVDIRCGHDLNKVILCHVPPGNPANPQTICIAPSAIPAHIGNHPDDCLGPCGNPRFIQYEASGLEFSIYPNPFTTETVIEFSVPENGNVKLELYDMKGSLVGVPFEGQAEGGSHYHVTVDGTSLTEGVYISRLVTANEVQHQRLILTK